MSHGYTQEQAESKKMGCSRYDGIYFSSQRAVHEKRGDRGQGARVTQSIPKGASLRDADVELLHQPRRRRLKPIAPQRVGEGQGAFVEEDRGPASKIEKRIASVEGGFQLGPL